MPSVSAGFQDFVLDLLGPLEPMPRRMFSGVGLFHGGVMFGLLVRDTMYLRVDDTTRERFERAGSEPFSYRRGERQVSLSAYYGVPEDLLDRQDELLQWARGAEQLRVRDLPRLVQVLGGIEKGRPRITAEIRQHEELAAVGQISRSDGIECRVRHWCVGEFGRKASYHPNTASTGPAREVGDQRTAIASADLHSRGMLRDSRCEHRLTCR
jgi:DNA transformation protein and related proteins